jgi:hypothetical protein
LHNLLSPNILHRTGVITSEIVSVRQRRQSLYGCKKIRYAVFVKNKPIFFCISYALQYMHLQITEKQTENIVPMMAKKLTEKAAETGSFGCRICPVGVFQRLRDHCFPQAIQPATSSQV